MRYMRGAILGAALAIVCFGASAMEHDIRQLQARLAEQEARLGDMHAKVYGGGDAEGPEGIVSLRKNATVTIGGLINTKYTYTNAKIDSVYGYDDVNEVFAVDGAGYGRRARSKSGSLEVSDAELSIQIDVNEHFDAFLNMDLHNGTNDDYFNAEVYYVRWKDICNSGFGLKIGRDQLVFGEEGVGELNAYTAGGDGLGELDEDFLSFAGMNIGGEAFGGAIPLHNGWDVSGVTQVTPYWEGLDGKLAFELSFMQNVYEDEAKVAGTNALYRRDTSSGYRKYRTKNYGLGTMSARAIFTPIEDLRFQASFVNYRQNGNSEVDDYSLDQYYSKNNTAFSLSASYRPCFFNRLMVWGQWVHGNDVYFYDGMKSDAINFGASFDIIEGLTYFAQGDYLVSKYKHMGENQKGKAWAFYTGIQYSLPYGVSMEAGWKHEQVKFTDKVSNTRLAKAKADTIYAMCGLEF